MSDHPQDTVDARRRYQNVTCPYCHAPEGSPCTDSRDGKVRASHMSRREKADGRYVNPNW